MRDLSDQEIKNLYESEYRNDVPELWNRIEERINHQQSEADVLHFEGLGKKRLLTIIASVAACFFIIGAYVLQQGSLPNSKSDSAPMGELSVGNAESTTAYAQKEINGDHDALAADEVGTDIYAEAQAESGESSDSVTNDVVSAEKKYNPERDSFLNIDGKLYVYDSNIAISIQAAECMQLLGDVTASDDKTYPSRHLNVTNTDISGKAYLSEEGYVCIVDDERRSVFVYVMP